MRSSIFHDNNNKSLPMWTQSSETQVEISSSKIRRRLSSLSLNNLKIKMQLVQPSSSISSSPAAVWAFRHSKSVSNWWNRGMDWILSRKPTFARDLEINEEEAAVLGGCHTKGTWRHVFYKVTSQLRRKLLRTDNVGLPQTFRYDSFNYAKNFEDDHHN